MATTFEEDETSASGSRPIDLYVITAPSGGTYRLTSHVVDVVYAGNTYTATTMDRGTQQVAQELTGREMVVFLPISHPVVQRFAASGLPERTLLITQYRLQERSGVAESAFRGFAQGLSIDGQIAALRVPSLTDDALKVRLPTVRAQRLCNHVLFDAGCRASRDLFTVATTVVSSDGVNLTVGTMNGAPDQYAAPGGEIVHTTSGERRSVLQQTGVALILNAPFVALVNGDAVTVSAACDHDLFACRNKFANLVNFGGMPHMNPAVSPWAPRGLGIIEQS